MNERPLGWSFWSKLNPNLTFRLLLIIIFLALIAFLNLFGLYDNFIKHDMDAALLSLFTVCLYSIPAYGLFKLKRWARSFEIVFSCVCLILGVIMLLFESIASGVFIIATHGLIVKYLLSKECKQAIGITS
ncbi:hypothetical protein SDC9_06161 [bioreactor metagenome]|uniref:Uncharacterized protein n=1 Tax=bioreactor metagenome TaxID=1076179 RepID=A0A644T0Y5_9ZZZZ|nr:hypothetical protein [Negativicutes bacterium]